MRVTGTFEIVFHPEPPYDDADGVPLARARIDKRFTGPLDATSVAHMTGARTPVDGSAGYIAIERVVGTLDGRRGSFVLVHQGLMDRGAQRLIVTVVPDSGTGELAGLRGTMDIQIVEGQHHYAFEYRLG